MTEFIIEIEFNDIIKYLPFHSNIWLFITVSFFVGLNICQVGYFKQNWCKKDEMTILYLYIIHVYIYIYIYNICIYIYIYVYIIYTYIYSCIYIHTYIIHIYIPVIYIYIYIYICSKSKSTIETLKKVVKYICSGTRLAFLLPTLNN